MKTFLFYFSLLIVETNIFCFASTFVVVLAVVVVVVVVVFAVSVVAVNIDIIHADVIAVEL